jgi:hypothetical protein
MSNKADTDDKTRHIPHYIIESRNLFNSKLTEKMSKQI